jgi:hypothetical protein
VILEEAMLKLGEVERRVAELLRAFELDTGLEIDYVHLLHDRLVGSHVTRVNGVTVDVTLRSRR